MLATQTPHQCVRWMNKKNLKVGIYFMLLRGVAMVTMATDFSYFQNWLPWLPYSNPRDPTPPSPLISSFDAFRLVNLELFEALLLIKKMLIKKLGVKYYLM